MTRDDLVAVYEGYIDCLNRRALDDLGRFVHDAVSHDGRAFGLSGYRAMLEADMRAIPDLRFVVERLACDPPQIAARLAFDCHPADVLFGVPVNGRRVRFSENVFYEFRDGRIHAVRSVIDKAAVAAQVAGEG